MPRVTHQSQLILEALIEADELYGLELCERAHLPSGTVYPILARLESAGWLQSRWEELPAGPEFEGRPRRRYYRMTADGVSAVHEARRTTYRGGRKVTLAPAELG